MPIHGHHQIPEGPLISNSADSGFFSSHIFDIIPGGEVQVIMTTILGFHECFKAATKIKTFKSSLGWALSLDKARHSSAGFSGGDTGW